MGALNDNGVSPKLIVGGGNHRNCKCLLALRNRRWCERQRYAAAQEKQFKQKQFKRIAASKDHANSPISPLDLMRLCAGLYLSAH
jgi:hypothetical protein